MIPGRGCLLTGATGLLGHYLLRDLLVAGYRVTVLARDGVQQGAAERIAEIVAFWSEGLGRTLAVPRVIAGELGQGSLDLSLADRHWLSQNCQAVIHAAANLSFRSSTDGEPWRTNVEGSAALVKLCRQIGITEWHQVSTAYVCGRRQGLIREEELDCGQDFHNPYEQSKWEVERRLSREPGLRVTTYRPAVIIGDSRTGYTNSYTGFYRFLELGKRLAENLARPRASADSAEREFPLRLPWRGDEPCQLVCVDWVSHAIVSLVGLQSWQGSVFHLGPRCPIPARLVQEIAAGEFRLAGVQWVGPQGLPDPSRLEQLFLGGIQEYWPYLGGAQEFSNRNTMAAVPHLVPPLIDPPLLKRFIRFAVGKQWGRSSARSKAAQAQPWGGFDCAEYIERVFPEQARISPLGRAARLDLAVAFDVRGPGGGQWSCRWTRGEFAYVQRGLEKQAAVVYQTDSDTFQAVVSGRETPQQAFFEQRITLTGDLETGLKLAFLFNQFLRDSSRIERKEALNAVV